jgi:TonB family protein
VNARRAVAALFVCASACACAGRSPDPVAVASPSASTTAPPPVMRDGMRAQSLHGAAIQFASYLNRMHNRIHPEFTDKELVRFERMPPDAPVNDEKLKARLELVLSGTDGRIVGATIADSSGVADFDAAVVESVHRAAPFDTAPPEIVSADGNVHVDWEFARDETFACSTMHTRPFLLAR